MQKIALALDTFSLAEELTSAAQAAGARIDASRLRPADEAAIRAAIERTGVDVLFLEITNLGDRAAHVVANLRKNNPGCAVVALCGHNRLDTALSVYRAGAADYVSHPIREESLRCLQRLEARSLAQPGSPEGAVLAVAGVKGGSGVTTIAAHLADALSASMPGRVAVLDLHLGAAMLSFVLKVDSPHTLSDVCENLGRLDESYWKAVVTTRGNLDILTGCAFQDAPEPAAVARVLQFARRQYRLVLCDCGPVFSAGAAEALEAAAEILLVATPEPASLYRAKLVCARLKETSGAQSIRLIVNRTAKRLDLSPDELSDAIGHPIDTWLINDYHGHQEACLRGGLMSKRTKFAMEIADLAARLTGGGTNSAQPARTGLWPFSAKPGVGASRSGALHAPGLVARLFAVTGLTP